MYTDVKLSISDQQMATVKHATDLSTLVKV